MKSSVILLLLFSLLCHSAEAQVKRGLECPVPAEKLKENKVKFFQKFLKDKKTGIKEWEATYFINESGECFKSYRKDRFNTPGDTIVEEYNYNLKTRTAVNSISIRNKSRFVPIFRTTNIFDEQGKKRVLIQEQFTEYRVIVDSINPGQERNTTQYMIFEGDTLEIIRHVTENGCQTYQQKRKVQGKWTEPKRHISCQKEGKWVLFEQYEYGKLVNRMTEADFQKKQNTDIIEEQEYGLPTNDPVEKTVRYFTKDPFAKNPVEEKAQGKTTFLVVKHYVPGNDNQLMYTEIFYHNGLLYFVSNEALPEEEIYEYFAK